MRETGCVVAAVVASALALCACSDMTGEAARLRRARTNAHNAVLIASPLPQSVVFRNEVAAMGEKGPVVCGEFDGQSRRREPMGFRRFVYADGELTLDKREPEFDVLWRACRSADPAAKDLPPDESAP